VNFDNTLFELKKHPLHGWLCRAIVALEKTSSYTHKRLTWSS